MLSAQKHAFESRFLAGGHSFTIWGELRDAAGFETLEAIARLPYHETTGAGGTVMRLLDTELPTNGAIVASAASTDAESALSREL